MKNIHLLQNTAKSNEGGTRNDSERKTKDKNLQTLQDGDTIRCKDMPTVQEKAKRWYFKVDFNSNNSLGGLGAVAGGGDSDGPSDSSPKKVESESKGNSNENGQIVDYKEDSKNKESEPDNEFNVGDVVEASDLKISFTNVEEYTPENEFMQSKEGNVYYKMDFEFENISDSDQYISSFDFKCYADGYDMEQSYMDELDLDATLSPGKKTKGSVFFEVPIDSSEIILEYETNFWTEEKIVFVVK